MSDQPSEPGHAAQHLPTLESTAVEHTQSEPATASGSHQAQQRQRASHLAQAVRTSCKKP